MAAEPSFTCASCGKPIETLAKPCPACGAHQPEPGRSFRLDDSRAWSTKPRAPATPPPARGPQEDAGAGIRLADDAPPPRPAAPEEPEAAGTTTTAAGTEAAPAPPAPQLGGDTVRMSLRDATQAWLEEAPAPAPVPEPTSSARSRRRALLLVLALALAALAAVLVLAT